MSQYQYVSFHVSSETPEMVITCSDAAVFTEMLGDIQRGWWERDVVEPVSTYSARTQWEYGWFLLKHFLKNGWEQACSDRISSNGAYPIGITLKRKMQAI